MESEEEDEYSNFSAQLQGSMGDIENKLNLNTEIKRKSITNEKWFKELKSRKINKDQLNHIIANYLFIQGYCLPLKKFIAEAKIKFNFDENLLNKRFLIRELITKNKIKAAIDEINSLNKNILKENKILLFILQRQILINYMQENNLNDALIFAQKSLLPLVEGDAFLYKELENTMGLMAYENINDAPEKELVTEKFLEKIASKTNLVILNFLSKDKMINLNLEMLIKLMNFTQNELKSEIDFPKITSLSPLMFSVVNK
jgi:hypothetical protein